MELNQTGPILPDDSGRPGARQEGEHERTGGFALARFEAWALPRMARALPAWVTPDHLTGLGLLASTLIAVAYVLTKVKESPDKAAEMFDVRIKAKRKALGLPE